VLWATELGSSTGRLEIDPPVLAKTPIIAVSSFAMIGDEGKARATGCDHSASNRSRPLHYAILCLLIRRAVAWGLNMETI
jgi:hypothetical protein